MCIRDRARAVLDLADITGSEAVIREARTILNLSRDVPAAEDVLFEMLKLADSLRNLCGIQLTENHHGGQCWIRGAYLQTRSMPLNDYQYLMQSFKRIEKMQNEKNRCAALHQLNLRQDPVSYTHLRAHETRHDLVCRLLLEKKKKKKSIKKKNNKQ